MELTAKGHDMLKISKESKSINALYSVLAEDELQQTYSSLTKLFTKLKEGIDS
jgi:DNA-binding MarR family transcriptional regulator